MVSLTYPYLTNHSGKKKSIGSVFMDIFRGFRYMPKGLIFITALFYLSWSAYAPLMVNLTEYFGNDVYPCDHDVCHSLSP